MRPCHVATLVNIHFAPLGAGKQALFAESLSDMARKKIAEISDGTTQVED